MPTLTLREGLGRPLTYQEMDDNLRFVEVRAQEAGSSAESAGLAAQLVEADRQHVDQQRQAVDAAAAAVDQAIANAGYVGTGPNGEVEDYAEGIEITARNQIIRADGELWRISASADLPYTTSGDWAADSGDFVAMGDAVLRQELADPDKGAAMVARAPICVDSIADLLALPPGQRKIGVTYLVKGYHPGSVLGGGKFSYNPISESPADNVITFGSGIGRFIRTNVAALSMADFGESDLATLLERIDVTPPEVLSVSVPDGEYTLPYPIVLTRSNMHIRLADNALVDCSPTHNGSAVQWTGTVKRTIALASTVAAGGPVIELAEVPASLSPGDLLEILSDELIFSNSRVHEYRTEMVEVADVNERTVTLTEPLLLTYSTGYNARVNLVDAVENAKISGGKFKNIGAPVSFGIRFDYARNGEIRNVGTVGFNWSGITVFNNYGTDIAECRPVCLTAEHDLNYGITVYTSRGVNVYLNRVKSERTAIDLNWGAIDCSVWGNTVRGSINTHTAFNSSITFNTVREGGTLLRGVGLTLASNNYRSFGKPSAIGFSEGAMHGASTVTGNTFEGRWRGDESGAANLYPNGSVIDGNIFRILPGDGMTQTMFAFRTNLAMTDMSAGLTVTDNTFDYLGKEAVPPSFIDSPSFMGFLNDVSFRGNKIRGWFHGIRIILNLFGFSSGLSIHGNTIRVSGGNGISWRYISNVSVVGNTLQGNGAGSGVMKVSEDGDNIYNGFVYDDNTVSGFDYELRALSGGPGGVRYYYSVLGQNSVFDTTYGIVDGGVFEAGGPT